VHCLETPNSPAILTLLTYLLRGVGRHPPHDRRGVRHLRRLGAAARRRRQEAAAPAVPHAARALRPTAAAAAASAHASRSWAPRRARVPRPPRWRFRSRHRRGEPRAVPTGRLDSGRAPSPPFCRARALSSSVLVCTSLRRGGVVAHGDTFAGCYLARGASPRDVFISAVQV